MPVLIILYDENLDSCMREHRHQIEMGLSAMMRNTLLADPEKCQVIMNPVTFIAPTPVYVEIQFRATNLRNRKVVAKACEEIAASILSAVETDLRIRAFDIDQAGLHALDVKRSN